MKLLLNYFNGYVKIKVEGFYIERFINICNASNIFLWNMIRHKSTILYTNISVKQYRNTIIIAKKTGCRVEIQKKKGLPFIINKYKKRKVFFISIIFVMILFIVLSNFVWNIEIVGNDKIDKYEILELIEKQGLKVGRLKSKINTREIINNIRLQRNDVAWVGIDFIGTNAKVQIVESKEKPEIINEEDYCNIIATKTAVITKVKAQNGTPLVKEGDVVKKGQILIGGYLEGKYTEARYVHSEGQVEAKVWYSHTEKVYLNNEEKVKTGNIENKYSIKINNFKINLYKIVTKFKICDTIRTEKVLKMFNDFYLPIQLIKTTNYEMENITNQLSRENAIEIRNRKRDSRNIKKN